MKRPKQVHPEARSGTARNQQVIRTFLEPRVSKDSDPHYDSHDARLDGPEIATILLLSRQ